MRILKPTAPLHPTVEPELEALSVDPLTVGNVQETFARFIRNGETVVFVLAASDQEAEFATDSLRQYDPITINALPFSSELELSNSGQNLNLSILILQCGTVPLTDR